MFRSFFVVFMLLGVIEGQRVSSTRGDAQDSDEILRKILLDYYDVLERHKQRQLEHEPVVEEHEESPEVPMDDIISDSLTDSVMDYIRDHFKTRVWSRLSNTFSSPPKTHPVPDERTHDYTNTHLWWENEEPMGVGGMNYQPNMENPTRQMVNRVFTASGFALSLVVMVVFFFACTYCWCISSPSRMIGTLSTILAIILLLHRLHEFFLVFSPQDFKNVGEAFLGTNGWGTEY